MQCISIVAAACLSPALNGSLGILHIERSDALEIHDGITFVFYPGPPHMTLCVLKQDPRGLPATVR